MKKNLTSNTPADLGFIMPGEWESHSRCWMAWPSAHEQWQDIVSVEKAYAAVANAIAQFEPVSMVADPSCTAAARHLCDSGVDIVEMPINDSWMRDTGPSFLKNKQTGEIAGVNWRFNCWGGYYPQYQEDAQMANRVLGLSGMDAYHSSLVMEGGALHVDGEGTLVTTESVVLNANRNWGLDKAQAEVELCRATGASKVIWLPGDLNSDTSDMTDGHVDGIMCFVKPGVVMFEIDTAAQGVFAELEHENRRALELATDARGRRLEIIDLKSDQSHIGENYDLFCSSYINFYLPNGGLVMPSYGVDSDDMVREQLSRVFSDRYCVSVDLNAIAPGGGGIHCITQQQPE